MKIDRMTIYTNKKVKITSLKGLKKSHISYISISITVKVEFFSDIKPRSSAHILGIFDEVKALSSVDSVTYH